MAKRRAFDPARTRAARNAREAAPTAPGTLSVREVNELVRTAIARHVPATLHVLGEIGDFTKASSGHLYFTLKDRDAELRCVMWRSAAAKMKFEVEVGMEVIATGGVEIYSPRGTYQLIARTLEPRGVGALEVAFRQLKEKLEREGLFDPARKRPLPRFPHCVAIVTSPTGAAIRDILQTISRRFPVLEVLVFPVRVQGAGAAEEIAAAIRLLNDHAEALGGIDAAIVGRGGGSLEDLWAFNEEVVARAIAASRVPIVSAVGHEIDVSISDLVADLRAPTPTAAAELLTPSVPDLIDGLNQISTRAARAVRHALELAAAGLERTLAQECLARPRRRLRDRGQLLDEARHRLRMAISERFRRSLERVGQAERTVLHFGSGTGFARIGRRLSESEHRVDRALGRVLLRHERRVVRGETRLSRRLPQRALARFDERLRQACERLSSLTRSAVRQRGRLLDARLESLAACHPQRVLERGYSIARDAKTRRILRSVAQIRDGLRVVTQLSDGEFKSTADDPKQPGLFD